MGQHRTSTDGGCVPVVLHLSPLSVLDIPVLLVDMGNVVNTVCTAFHFKPLQGLGLGSTQFRSHSGFSGAPLSPLG